MIVEQALHGYASGHRLLRSSGQIPPDAQRLMLPISDAVDGRVLDEFDGYLTGYPLSDMRSYALARTWAAPELQRPGCVWTHTLLVRFSDLGRVTDPETLLPLFRRPSDDLSVYDEPLSLEPSHSVPGPALPHDRLRHFLGSFYAKPRRSLAFVTDSHLDETLVLALWRQQWPRLRRSFTFCTAGWPTRSIGDRFFDLQFLAHGAWSVPSSVLRRVAVIDDEVAPKDSRTLRWADVAAKDAASREPTSLRTFLWHYGAEAKDPRAAFAPLVRSFSALQEARRRPAMYDAVVRTVAPLAQQSQTSRLTQDLLGRSTSRSSMQEAHLLAALVKYGNDAFDPDEFELRERSQVLAGQADDAAVLVAAAAATSHPPTMVAQQLLEGIAEGASPQLLERLRDQAPLAVSSIVELRPDLASAPHLWGDEKSARELFIAINARGVPGQRTLRRLMPSLLASTVAHLPDLVLKRWGPGTYDLAVDALSELEADSGRVGRGWIELLGRDSTKLVEWLTRAERPLDPRLLAVAARSLDPSDPDVLSAGASKWLPLARSSEVTDSSDANSAVFLLALGLFNPGPGSEELVTHTFRPVHRAVATRRLPKHLWGLLRPHVRERQAETELDRSDQLRRAFVRVLLREGWPAETLLEAAPQNPLFRELLEVTATKRKGQRLLRDLADRTSRGDVRATPAQRRAIDDVASAERA